MSLNLSDKPLFNSVVPPLVPPSRRRRTSESLPSSTPGSHSSQNTTLPDTGGLDDKPLQQLPDFGPLHSLFNYKPPLPNPMKPTHNILILSRRGYEILPYGRLQPQQRSLMIPEILSRKADAKELDRLLDLHIAQLQAEEQVELNESDEDSEGFQRKMLEAWREKAQFELELLGRVQPLQ